MSENGEVAIADQMSIDYAKLKQEVGKQVIGQHEVIDQLIISLFCGGHSLLIGVPGLAKTLLVQTVAKCFSLDFNRIQFTPDLMPSDILGAEILDKERNIRFIKGPIFTNIVLADEINRTPPKTQAALLESMQERHVTIAGQNHTLDAPFFVLATQNPIEQEGTYPLPEAQLDRFMFMIQLTYPTYEEEVEIIKNTTGQSTPDVSAIISKETVLSYQKLVRKVPITDHVLSYAVGLVTKTRPLRDKSNSIADEYLQWGAGPRAGQYLVLAAKCHALIHGKYSPDVEDVKAVAAPVLAHRIIKNFKAEAEGLSERDIVLKLL